MEHRSKKIFAKELLILILWIALFSLLWFIEDNLSILYDVTDFSRSECREIIINVGWISYSVKWLIKLLIWINTTLKN